ncbi:BNR repeat-containing protein [Burkholderia diffusa]|uniref:BNR repeat-containing protein n=1 Tax=Burkholderia diffusa TaxID=488732 RepID=UPI0015838D98|nr:BNR repeat-containing protein [Burkholderia diffusa]
METKNVVVRLLVLLSVAASSVSWAADATDAKCVGISPDMKIDRVWGASRVKFDALEDKKFVYVSYYDADRWLSVAQINKCTGEVEKTRVASRFVGWDAHNSIVLALDRSNRLHVSGNMHASPLVYARMDAPDKLAGLEAVRPMIGSDEAQATYPYFFRFMDGALGFSYRSGHSGDGEEFINRLENSGWVRWTNRPIFAPTSEKKPVNAYHTNYVRGPDGFFHVAWVWRENYFVETNFNVNYAKSRDLKTWQNSAGDVIPLPITPKSAEVVDEIPERSGLLNNIRLGFDEAGRPVISYLKFDSKGATQLFHARLENGIWKTAPATQWTYRWDPRGGGTIKGEINFSGVKASGGHLIEQVSQPEIGAKTLVYDDKSMKVAEALSPSVWSPSPAIRKVQAPKGAVPNVQMVRFENMAANESKQGHAVTWFSLPADNRDKPRNCDNSAVPCDFTSDLILHTDRESP